MSTIRSAQRIIAIYVKKRWGKITLITIGTIVLLAQVRSCEDEDPSKKQIWCEYDAMKGYASLSFDVFKSELKGADTTRRLNVIKDNHEIHLRPEWLNNRASNGEDSIKIFLEANRSIINYFTRDSQGVYICAVRRLIYNNDSNCGGVTYRNIDTTVYNEVMCAIAVATTRDSCLKYNVIVDNKLEYFAAHEIGHAFNLNHCNAGCVMRTAAHWTTYYLYFCFSCKNILGQQRP